jgi:predicted lipoprotein with Yx(FWY)xxD motif
MKQTICSTLRKKFVLSLLLTSALLACKKDDKQTAQPQPLVKLSTSATLGSYLTDKDGNTLYYFANDADGTSTCTGGCLTVWPTFYAGDFFTGDLLQTGLDIADFGVITSATGQKQTTYKGWPLYYYAPAVGSVNTREAPGEVKGEGVGGVWFVGKPDYTINLVNAQLVGHDGKNYKSDLTEGVGKTLYFTDDRGRTLYTFSKDSSQKNEFTNATFSNNSVWPIYETGKIVVPSTLDKSLFGSITVFGKTQLMYKGWPLYYFGQDGGTRGSNKGVSFPTPGIWPVALKDRNPAP